MAYAFALPIFPGGGLLPSPCPLSLDGPNDGENNKKRFLNGGARQNASLAPLTIIMEHPKVPPGHAKRFLSGLMGVLSGSTARVMTTFSLDDQWGSRPTT